MPDRRTLMSGIVILVVLSGTGGRVSRPTDDQRTQEEKIEEWIALLKANRRAVEHINLPDRRGYQEQELPPKSHIAGDTAHETAFQDKDRDYQTGQR